MKALDFYFRLTETISRDANFYGIQNIERYYQLTDLRDNLIVSLGNGSINQAYGQFAAHLQNGTLIDKIVDFWNNFNFLKDVFCQFNPNEVLRTWQGKEKDLIERLRYNEITNPNGLKWSTSKSKKPDVIITRYVNGMLKAAEYFATKSNKEEVVQDLLLHNQTDKTLIEYVISKVSGMSIALVCDFLKEFDRRLDLIKPDTHLMDTMAKYYNTPRKIYDSYKGAFKCIEDFNKLHREINENGIAISRYVLDRMIWMCCAEPSRRYFLDKDKKFGAKERFLDF